MEGEMGGERSVEGVLAGVGSGAGVPGLLGLLVAMEAGVPIPVPSDLVMLLLGERVSAGALPLWLAALALELVALTGTGALFLAAGGPGRALLRRAGPRLGLTEPRLARATELLERRGWPALATGRTTPGLRTVTVVAAASSGIRAGRALPALVLGSSLFLQAHLLLGYALGPAARELLEQARLPVLVAAAIALAIVAALLLLRRRTRATRVLAEGACPACLALGLAGTGLGGRAEQAPSGAESPGGGA
jgi:membrane protein DedA with SNARE-associated domain